MKRTLTIETGAKTCASEPGEFCRFVVATNFGTRPGCSLFTDELGRPSRLEDKDGWLQRTKACINELGE